MDNKLELTLDEIIAATKAKRMAAPKRAASREPSGALSEMAYDSRKAGPNSVFLCIAGNRSDGHDFAGQAIAQGAAVILGDNEKKLAPLAKAHPEVAVLKLGDSLGALQKLATFYRAKFKIPAVGLTGSSGKTTTKDLIASIFRGSENALITEGTLNNHWGVPQTVLGLRRHHKAAIFEMGTSGFGEIAALSAICQPETGFITTVGASHLETLKDEEGVLKAKRELFDWIEANAAEPLLVFNLDNPYLERLHGEFARASRKARARCLTFSTKKPETDLRLIKNKPLGFEHRYGWEYFFATPWGTLSGVVPLPGPHNLANALAAAGLALSTGVVGAAEVTRGLANPQISKLRSNLFRTKSGALIYDDSYNANPTSVTALFEAARGIRLQPESKITKVVAVVGDMLELGENADELHREMGRCAALAGIDVLLVTGAHGQQWILGYRDGVKSLSGEGEAILFPSHADLARALQDDLKTDPDKTLVLVKGSRGARMDQIVAELS